MDESEYYRRIQQLYALLQPHAAGAQALLDRWEREDPLDASGLGTAAPDEFVALLNSVSELPVGEVAALLEAVIAADKGDEAALDPGHMTDVLSKLDAQIQSASEDIQGFAKRRVPLPAPLSSELEQALRTEEARLERDLAAARARMLTERDMRLLREANVPGDTIAAIVRDAPAEAEIDQLATQLEELRQLLAASVDGARLAEQLDPLEALTSAARGLLAPILDPRMVARLEDLAQPLLEPDDRPSPGG